MTKRYSCNILMALGLLLLLAAGSLTAYNIWEAQNASACAENALAQVHLLRAPAPDAPGPLPTKQEEIIPDYQLDPTREMPSHSIDGRDYIGTLEIPALGKSLPIIGDWSYPSLKVAPNRYTGSVYTDDMTIAGHNYRSHFAGLGQLKNGDVLSFTDMDGNLFSYEVGLVEILPPTAVEELTVSDWDLSLFTCTTGGQARVVVRCQRQIVLDW